MKQIKWKLQSILGQTNIWIKLKNIKKVQEIEALVCKEKSDESLIDLDSLQDKGTIHKDFPFPMNKMPFDTYPPPIANETKENED